MPPLGTDAPQSDAAREAVFERAQELAASLVDRNLVASWEPLRDLILAGLEAGGMRYASDNRAVRAAAAELSSAALDARRHA